MGHDREKKRKTARCGVAIKFRNGAKGERKIRVECIEALITTRREIEFEYKGEMYSIAYRVDENKKIKVRCGKFYGERAEFDRPYDVIDYKIGDKTIEQIFAELPDGAFEIF